jgi:hypothetical protein
MKQHPTARATPKVVWAIRGATEVVALPGDSVLVIDGPLARGTIYGPDLNMRRSLRSPY